MTIRRKASKRTGKLIHYTVFWFYTDIAIKVTLFAQNGTEMYILNAVHTDGYTQHMTGDKQKAFVKQDEFLRIHKYGPYLIYQEKDTEYFAKLALTVALRASEEEGGRN